MANSIERDARNLADATLILAKQTKDLLRLVPNPNVGLISDVANALDYAESEARKVLARTVGA